MIKRIDKIAITNVKGIENSVFNVHLIPNKPTLIVAPNGFGKSSITTAFACLRSNKMDLSKDEYHKGDESRSPSLKISYTTQDGNEIEKEANQTQNEIATIFDIHVIKCQLVSKAKKLKIKGAPIVTSAIEVTPVVLIKNIPQKKSLSTPSQKQKRNLVKMGRYCQIFQIFSPITK